MPAPPRLVLLALVLAACGDPAEPFALPEVCGAPGPVRVLELPADTMLSAEPRRIGERVFYEVFTPGTGRQALWTTGPCGESPTLLPGTLERPFAIDRWPELALLCDSKSNSIVSVAPAGPLAPNVVFPDSGCAPIWSEFGPIVRVQAEGQADGLRLYPWPDDPRSETAEYGPLTDVSPGLTVHEPSMRLAGDRLFVITSLAQLVRIELPGGEVTLEQTDVGAFAVSPDGRFVLWQASGGKINGPAITSLRDIETGVSVGLGAGDWIYNDRAFDHPDYMVFNPAQGPTRIYRLPDLSSFEVPDGFTIDALPGLSINGDPLPDGRWILHDWSGYRLAYLEPSTGEVLPMFNARGAILIREADGVMALQIPDSGFSRWDSRTDTGPLWFLPFDGSPAQLMAERASVYTYAPNDHQLLTALDLDGEQRGTLVLLDRGDLHERVIDHHVYALPMVWAAQRDPELVRYSVQDGERSGVWLARLP